MAVEAEVDGEAAATSGKKGGKLKIIIMAGAAVAVLLIGAGAYFFLFAPKPATDEHGAAAIEAPHSFIFNLPAMTVNLNSENGQQGFMKLTIALEVADEAMMTQIQPNMAKLVDSFQVYMRELRRSDLEGSAGIYRLKEELLRRVNLAIAPAHVQSILFKEILVQ